ncbi:hypothetical protein SEUCBS140593_009577 [Sporothrix eucalyptigena]|uniref:Short-chain dehydrogenase/reductase family protein n=1 Tax=Sporothrix eucalyptigena TaxID=1812306 RepID=A0ABP0CYP9_9PEZI
MAPNTAPFFPNQFIKNQFRTKPHPTPKDTDLSGQTIIVTGSNTGLGLECAKQLLSYKLSHLVMAVRSIDKGEAAAAPLRKQYPSAKIDVWPLDMTSYESIQTFVSKVDTDLPRLDVAVLNAGIGFQPFQIVKSTGHELTVQVNYLSTMLLAILLLPALKNKSPAGKPGRLTISTAMLSATAKFPNKNAVPLLPSFNDESIWDMSDIYSTSKLLGQMFLWKLTDIVSADNVVINMVEPGFIKGTDLHRERPGAAQFMLGLMKSVSARSVQLGATAYIDAAVVKGREAHGCILGNWEIEPYVPFQYTAEGKKVTEQLWTETLAEFAFVKAEQILKSV